MKKTPPNSPSFLQPEAAGELSTYLVDMRRLKRSKSNLLEERKKEKLFSASETAAGRVREVVMQSAQYSSALWSNKSYLLRYLVVSGASRSITHGKKQRRLHTVSTRLRRPSSPSTEPLKGQISEAHTNWGGGEVKKISPPGQHQLL